MQESTFRILGLKKRRSQTLSASTLAPTTLHD